MDLMDYRRTLDEIDDQLIELFRRRMETVSEIAAYKKEHSLPVLDAGRERAKVKELSDKMPPDMKSYTGVLYASLFELSRSYQNRQLDRYTDLSQDILCSIERTPRLFPQNASVALCADSSAFSHMACEKIFRMPFTMGFHTLESVFTAMKKGLCDYGVVPMESGNSSSGRKIFDLLTSHGFYIIRSVRMKTDYCLLARGGTQENQITEIFTHEGAISRCAAFIKTLENRIKITVCDSVEIAAERAADPTAIGAAALCPEICTELYGLRCIQYGVQDRDSTYTRFLCISRNMEIYPGADRTSIKLNLPHKPGTLYKLLAQLYALGINVNKLESRPVPEKDHEIAFYLELDASVYAPEFRQIICELSAGNEDFAYLGSYSEVV